MTTEERLEAIEQELARTKRRSRWLWGAVGLVVAVWIIGTVAFGGAKEIRASRFVLEDENGKDRAALEAAKAWFGSRLAMFDENGKDRAVLGMTENGSRLTLFDESGKVRAVLGMTELGPWLHLFDENGKLFWSAPR